MLKKLILFTLTLVLVACGPDNSHIRLTGHLLNLNQGEFLVYSPDGAISANDTIHLEGGRFEYEPRCEHDGSIIIVLPNKQEIPLFVTPGGSYSINGDAYNMKEMKVKGGKDNELMDAFRKGLADKPETYSPVKEIMEFAEKNPSSPVGIYLVRRYLLASKTPDYNTAAKALAIIKKTQPDNTPLSVLLSQVMELNNTSAGASMPSFSLKDINGRTISSGSLKTGTVIFVTQASWDYESSNTLSRVLALCREKGKGWKVVVISFDAEKQRCKNSVRQTEEEGYVYFDGNMSESVLARKFAVSQTNRAIVVQNGKIKERNKSGQDLIDMLEKL